MSNFIKKKYFFWIFSIKIIIKNIIINPFKHEIINKKEIKFIILLNISKKINIIIKTIKKINNNKLFIKKIIKSKIKNSITSKNLLI